MRHVVVACAVLLCIPIEAIGQPAATVGRAGAPQSTWNPPRTSDGQPDLQGIWLNNSATPLERPKAFEGKPLLSDAEVAELRKRAARLFNTGGASDFAAGDAFYQALLANPDRFENPNATCGDNAMIERVFENRTSLIVDPPDGRIPPLTPAGQKRLASLPPLAGSPAQRPAGPEDLSAPLRCLSYGVPRLGNGNITGAGPMGYYQIVQAPGYIVIFLEGIHEARIIPLDGRPHLPAGLRQWSGDSRGRWEGATLVIESSGFSALNNFLGSGEGLHLVERLTRVAPDTIDYELQISDPSTWTRPWRAVIHLKQRQEPIYEYACHEGNYWVMRGMLGAARLLETAEQR